MNQTPEKLIVKVDSQIVNSMDLCWERWHLEHILNWRPLDKALALERGSVQHRMVHLYRLGKQKGRTGPGEHGKLVEDCILHGRVYAAGTAHISNEEFEEDIRVFKDYVLRWQYDGWEILDLEQPFSRVLHEDDVPIQAGDTLYSGLTIIYEGVIDARVRDPKLGVVVVDTKTESRRSYPYVLSNQFQGYEWAWSCPVIIDKVGYQKTLKDEERFRRILHDSGAFAVEEWRQDVIEKIRLAVNYHNQLMAGRPSLPKNRTSCDKYSGCIFQKVCKVPVEVREYKLASFFYKAEPWDPYAREDDLEQEGEEA